MDDSVSQCQSVSEREFLTENPLVSIITPVLNSIRYLEPCLRSVLNQSYPHIEHIFVDGGSTDGSLDVLTSYQTRYPDRIRFISEPDKCAEDAWNKGLRMAKGGIFGWLGSDDIYELDAIQTVVEFFRANRLAYFVFGDCNIINEKDEIIRKRETKDFDLEEAINYRDYIPCPSAFYRREVIEKIGFIDTSLHRSDTDYWIRVGKVFPIHRIEKVLSNFRAHKGRFGGSKEANKIYARDGYIISRRYGGKFFSPRVRGYYAFVIIDWLRPVLGRFYPVIRKVLRK